MVRCALLIVFDCLRADHVSCYGYPRATTPTMDALAAKGVLWEQAYSTSSWTKPSVLSLLTGLYPSQHGGFEGVKRSKGRSGVTTDALRPTTTTLAERLSASGFRCGAFINNAQLGPFTGLNRGFEAYVPNAGKADRLIGLFSDWLGQGKGQPSFAYLHFLESHWPYKPRRRHIALFGGDRDTNLYRDYSARDFGRLRRALSHGDATLVGGALEQMIQMYDGAVRRLDGKLKVILSVLDELKLRDRTALFVTADHGEEFLDHGQIGHGQSLHEELTHVPMIASIPSGLTGVRRRLPVSQVDVAPTLLDWLGVEANGGERNLLAEESGSRPVFGELRIRNRYMQTIRRGEVKLHRRFKFQMPAEGGSPTSPPTEWPASLPHTVQQALYHISTDPHECVNLAEDEAHASECADLGAELDRWGEGLRVEPGEDSMHEVEIDSRVVQRLRDLGYID